MKINHRDNETSFCPLLDKEICQGECYDIQMVRSNAIKESALDFPLDRICANQKCETCLFNQLPNECDETTQ